MTPAALIEQELAAAEAARQDSNDGKARVCARRAVARATEAWLARLPLPIRQAAERLRTSVTRQHAAPFTSDPVADARLIIAHLSSTTSDNAPR